MNKSTLSNAISHSKNNGRLFQRVTLFVIWAWLVIFALLPNILVVLASFLTRDEDKFLAMPLTVENYLRFIDPLYVKVFAFVKYGGHYHLDLSAVRLSFCMAD
nr:hypothetical protein [Psychrobacter sp. PraFG1]UNK06299.1 hypothetical protein MN210_07050 [Psychrobacter sp. PraFG1]